MMSHNLTNISVPRGIEFLCCLDMLAYVVSRPVALSFCSLGMSVISPSLPTDECLNRKGRASANLIRSRSYPWRKETLCFLSLI